jgi:phytoene synthase
MQHLLSPDMLEQIQEKVKAVYVDKELNDNLLLAFKNTVDNYRIPKRYFDELIEGMYMDLNKNRYKNFTELYDYCYKVAGVVGLIMLQIFGYTNTGAEKHAKELGIAMQLTNVLRDIKEDYQRNRIYLPEDEMNKFGVSEDAIAKGQINENLVSLLKFQIKRARELYNNSSKGIELIAGLKSRLVVSMMKDMYAGILQSIEKNHYDVFSKRACVNHLGKMALAFKILLNPKTYEN